MRKLLSIIIVLTLLSGCTADKLAASLNCAGGNASELKRTLEYFKAKGDKQEYEAAKYIIENMPGHTSLYGEYESYCDDVDSILRGFETGDVNSHLRQLAKRYTNDDRICLLSDFEIIKADLLIHDIESAFDQWRNGEWAAILSYEKFREWLLPYTVSNTCPIYNWRDSLKSFAISCTPQLHQCYDFTNNPRAAVTKVNSALARMVQNQKWQHSSYGLSVFDPETFVKLPSVTCKDYSEMATMIMRSKGIPVKVDYTPQWPDRRYGHYWCVFPNIRGKTTVFNAFGSNPDYPFFVNCTFAKVFRKTYKANDAYLSLIKRNRNIIPKFCDDEFFEDVTDEYMNTIDLTVDLADKKTADKDLYIAVFDRDETKAVYWGKRENSTASFKAMGRNATYIIINKHNIPTSLPFRVGINGDINYYDADEEDIINIRLWRKYPMHNGTFDIEPLLHGGIIEASESGKPDDWHIVARLPEWELTSGIAEISQDKPFRYWRIKPSSDTQTDIAELFFYEKAEDKRNKDFTVICSDDTYKRMFDEDPLSNYSVTKKSDGFVDFGKAVTLGHISFIRRGDGNAIMPGDKYEISYWKKNKWVEHTTLVAEDIFIDINNLPANSLYYIRGASRGVQDRIFSWDRNNDTIVWM